MTSLMTPSDCNTELLSISLLSISNFFLLIEQLQFLSAYLPFVSLPITAPSMAFWPQFSPGGHRSKGVTRRVESPISEWRPPSPSPKVTLNWASPISFCSPSEYLPLFHCCPSMFLSFFCFGFCQGVCRSKGVTWHAESPISRGGALPPKSLHLLPLTGI